MGIASSRGPHLVYIAPSVPCGPSVEFCSSALESTIIRVLHDRVEPSAYLTIPDRVTALALLASITLIRFRQSLLPFRTRIYEFLTYPLCIPHVYNGPIVRVLFILAYLGTNTVLVFFSTSKATIFPQPAIINLVPLFLPGRTNPIADYLGISLRNYYIGHYWAGLMVTTLGIVHSKTAWFKAEARQRVTGIVLVILLSFSCLLSLPLFRNLNFTIFSKLHVLLSLAIFGILIGHVYLISLSLTSLAWIIIYSSGSIWLISQAIRLLRWTRHGSCEVLEEKKPKIIADLRKVRVRAQHSIATLPGGHFYVFLPWLPFKTRFQSRLAPIVWWDPRARGSTREFTILLEKEWALGLPQKQIPIINLDGPYGVDPEAEQYENVILAADGIGIAGILPFALSLMSRKELDKKDKASKLQARLFCDKTRKVNVFWNMDSSSQIELVSEYFEQLINLEVAKTLIQVILCYPSTQQPPAIPKSKYSNSELSISTDSISATSVPGGSETEDKMAKHFVSWPGDCAEKLSSVIQRETTCTPGRSITIACGTIGFTSLARRTAAEHTQNSNTIYFHELEYGLQELRQPKPKDAEAIWLRHSTDRQNQV